MRIYGIIHIDAAGIPSVVTIFDGGIARSFISLAVMSTCGHKSAFYFFGEYDFTSMT